MSSKAENLFQRTAESKFFYQIPSCCKESNLVFIPCLLHFSQQQDVSLILCTISRAYALNFFFAQVSAGRAIVENEVSHPAARMMSFPVFCVNGGGSFTVEGKYIILQRRNAHKTLQYFFKLYFPPISIFLVSDFEQQAYFFSSFRNCALERSFPSLQRTNNEFPIMSYSCCSFFPPRRTLVTSGPLSRV